jgi:hypothetical protein
LPGIVDHGGAERNHQWSRGPLAVALIARGKILLHALGGALFGNRSSPGHALADSDMDNDDNGVDEPNRGANGIGSTVITLAHGTEPGTAIDGDDSNGNLTIDFGFTAAEPGSPPQVVSAAANCSGGLVILEFNKQLDYQVGNDASHYDLSGVIAVLAAQVGSDLRHVYLTTSAALAQDQAYTVTVNGVVDLLGTPIAPNSQVTFSCDPTQPRIVSAMSACNASIVTVAFDKFMEASETLKPANYVFEPQVTVLSVSNTGDGRRFDLAISSPLDSGEVFRLSVNNVRDALGNPIEPNSLFFFSCDNSAVPEADTLDPASAVAGGPEFELQVFGVNFATGAVIHWNGAPRPTDFAGDQEVDALISQGDLVATGDITTVAVTVVNPGGQVSNPLYFTITRAAASSAFSTGAPPGQSTFISSAPSDGTIPTITAPYENSGEEAAILTVAVYEANPTPATVFDIGGGFGDIRVAGAQPDDTLNVNFYYPSTIAGEEEDNLQLLYFDGTTWVQVLESGGEPPVHDTTDNLANTISGGRFEVIFDNTSRPAITELNGTVFTVTLIDSTPPTVQCPTLPHTIAGAECLAAISNVLPIVTASDDISPVSALVLQQTPPAGTLVGLGTHTITVTVTDEAGNSGHCETTFAVINNPPVISILSGSAPVALGSPASVTVQFMDPDATQAHSCKFTWNDGSPDTVVSPSGSGDGACTAQHTFPSVGVYPVTVTVSDVCGGAATANYEFLVVYDPEGGFVTGGGWINSPAGAYTANPSLTGKATFGFVSKYRKGATLPTGQTQFSFRVADLDFQSASYEWLVVAGARAQFKGAGRINGPGDFAFILTAIDGQVNGGGGTDRFRIKIWNKDTGQIIYDNQQSSADTSDPTTTLGGGSIIIHKE